VAPTRVALALGGGGARGYAHIGVIEVLEQRGFEVVGCAGSSMGAVIGGLYAAGQLEPYTDWVRGLTQRDVFRLLDPAFRAPGAIRAEKVLGRMRDLLGGVRIEDLPMPFTAVATDLLAHKAVWFQRGPLDVAIRASIALPTFITPVMLNGRILVDGGLMDPVPIAPMAALEVDLTVAVSLSGERVGSQGAPASESSDVRPAAEWRDRFRRATAHLADSEAVRSLRARFGADRAGAVGGGEVPADPVRDLPPGLGMTEVIDQSIDAMQAVITRYRMAGSPPDVLVTVPKDACGILDFHRAEEMIEIGRQKAVETLDAAGLTA
jgi:NTE family protein